MNVGELVRKYCFDHSMTHREFADKCGVSRAYISMLINGRNPRTNAPITPTIEKYTDLAYGLDMTLDELFDAIDNAPIDLSQYKKDITIIGIDKLTRHRIPLIGSVAGGQPIYNEEVDLYIDGPSKASCAVKLQGKSMEPTYLDGDIIYIQEQPNVRDGQVAVVFLDEEAVLKRVYHTKTGLQLLSDNRDFPPITANARDYNNLRILGIPCGFTRMFA